MKRIVLSGAALALIISCAPSGKAASTVPVENAAVKSESPSWEYIEKSAWKLIQFKGKAIAENNPVIQFDRSEGKLFGFNGCNRAFGTFDAKADTITVNMGGSTMMACSPEAMELERQFMESMTGKTYTYDIADQTLNMYENGALVLLFGKTDKEE